MLFSFFFSTILWNSAESDCYLTIWYSYLILKFRSSLFFKYEASILIDNGLRPVSSISSWFLNAMFLRDGFFRKFVKAFYSASYKGLCFINSQDYCTLLSNLKFYNFLIGYPVEVSLFYAIIRSSISSAYNHPFSNCF